MGAEVSFALTASPSDHVPGECALHLHSAMLVSLQVVRSEYAGGGKNPSRGVSWKGFLQGSFMEGGLGEGPVLPGNIESVCPRFADLSMCAQGALASMLATLTTGLL